MAMASLVASVILVFAPLLPPWCAAGRDDQRYSASRAGGNLTGGQGGQRRAWCAFKRIGNRRQQGGRLERLLQAPDRAELGGHRQEIRAGTGGDRIARDHDDRN